MMRKKYNRNKLFWQKIIIKFSFKNKFPAIGNLMVLKLTTRANF